MTLTDQTNSLCDLLDAIDIKESFDYVYLDSSCFEVDGQTYTTKHYPLNDSVNFENIPQEFKEVVLDRKLSRVHKSHAMSLRANMLEYMKENPKKRGTIYFSPAATSATINTEAKSVYIFGLGSVEEGSMEIHSESNYLII